MRGIGWWIASAGEQHRTERSPKWTATLGVTAAQGLGTGACSRTTSHRPACGCGSAPPAAGTRLGPSPPAHEEGMSTPFVRLTVSGITMEGDASWTGRMRWYATTTPSGRGPPDTVQELVTGDAMTARTSGTTGPPKEMRFPAKDLMASAHLTGEAFHLRPGDTALLALPCNFIAGKMMLARAFVLGLDLRVVPPQGRPRAPARAGLTHDFAPLVGANWPVCWSAEAHSLTGTSGASCLAVVLYTSDCAMRSGSVGSRASGIRQHGDAHPCGPQALERTGGTR